MSDIPKDVQEAAYTYMASFRKEGRNNYLHPWVAARIGFLAGVEHERARSAGLVTALENLIAVSGSHWRLRDEFPSLKMRREEALETLAAYRGADKGEE